MNKKILCLVAAGLLGGAAVANVAMNKVVADEPEHIDIFGDHNYFTGSGGVWGANEFLADQGEGTKYTRLTTVAGADNGFFLMDSETKHAGKYQFSAKMRPAETFDPTDNIGFGFWAGGSINNRIHDTVISSFLVANEWRDVVVTFDLNEAEATAIDSIHMWNLAATRPGYVDIRDMKFVQVLDGVLENSIFKDVGFENVDLAGGDRMGWNDRHSGVIGCKDNQLLWTKETTEGGTNQFLRMRYDTTLGDQVQFVDFCSFFNDWNGVWPAGIRAGEYLVEMDVRPNDNFDTDNMGFAFFSTAGARIERDLTPQVRAAAKNEWTRISYRYPDTGVELTQAYADGVDTIQVWCNSKNINGWALDIDNVSVRRVKLVVDERPELEGGIYSFAWVEAEQKDLELTVSELHGHDDIQLFQGEYQLGLDEDYKVEGNKVTIFSDFISVFDDGIETFKIQTSGGYREFTVEITHVQEDLPNIADYELEETIYGGDFMDVPVGYQMKEEQTVNAWGAVSAYDDGGIVVEENDGSRALELKKPAGSARLYASSFVIYHPEKIVENTIVTFSMDYKYTGATTDGAVNVCWVGSSNISYHLVELTGSKKATTQEPDPKYRAWDVTYTDLNNGYTHFEYSCRIDAATVTATNSIRFLMMYNGSEDQSLRIQNVSLKRWVKSLGHLDASEFSFDKANPADVVINATFGESLSFYGLTVDSRTTYVDEKNYTAISEGNTVKVTLKAEYLATLTNGDHSFFVSSTENAQGEYAELEAKVTVFGEVKPTSSEPTPSSSEPAPISSESVPTSSESVPTSSVEPGPTSSSEEEKPAKKGCGGSIAAFGAITFACFALSGIILAKSRKEDK